MNDGWVESVDEERDLGVLMSEDSKNVCWHKMLMLGIINGGVSYKSPKVVSKPYRLYV